MRFTENYKLGSFESGEPLSPLEDSRRFLTIDRQLLGLFQVFGNGVISGWDLSSTGGLAVSVTPGRAHVGFLAAQTTVPRLVDELVPNATNYIYAQVIETTRFNRDVRMFSDTTFTTNNGLILLGAAITNASGVTSIDTTQRDDISFIETIETLINQHRHRGGDDSPSKIDLSSEVTGQLPSFRIDSVDASKVTSGRFAPARLPTIDHGDLLNSGILTHPQLDSFVRNLSNDNVRLLGELSSTNLLQAWLALKHIWHDTDEFTFNMLAMIPGITPDSFSDLQATTAVFDRSNHAIQGVPSLSGSLLSTTFRTSADFQSANVKVNIDINGEGDPDFFQLTKPLTETIVEGFDNVFSSGAEFPAWTLETVGSSADTSFSSDSSKKADGAFSAELDIDQSFRVQVTRFFDSPQDWTDFNELEVSVETRSSAHGQIRLQILSGTEGASDFAILADFLLLNTNEITSGFRQVILDILTVEDRDAVSGIRIFTDSGLGWDLSPVVFNVDRIRLNNNLFFKESGSIRFRFEAPQKSQWAAVSWDADLNGGTIQARARTAPNFAVMDQTSSVVFSPFFSDSGGDPDVEDNTNIEVELALAAAPGLTSSPVVRSVTLSFITSSQSTGFTIDSTDEFLRASRQRNTKVESFGSGLTDGRVLIDGRIDVGDVYFGNIRSIQQLDEFGTPIVGITGNRLPLSPVQAAATEFILRQPSFDGVSTVIRNDDRTYLVTDTINDRVLLLDAQGNVLKGLASNNARTIREEGLFPLTASYNRETSTVYVAWTGNVAFDTVDLSQFTVQGSGVVIRLSNNSDTIVRVQGRNSQLDSANVTAIELSEAHAAELEFFLNSQSVSDPRLFLDVAPEAVSSGLDLGTQSFATLATARGIPMPVAPIIFVRGIFRPISVSVTESGNWLVGNAKPILTNEEGVDITSGVARDEITTLLEMDPDTGEVLFSDNSVDFSLVTLGGAVELNERYVAVAGITKDETQPTGSTTTSTISASLGIGEVSTSVQTVQPAVTEDAETGVTTTTTSQTSLDIINEFRGRVKIIEKSSGRVILDEPTSDGTFGADVQEDADGNLVVVEKSFDGQVGRGRVVKVDEYGNVFFQFGFKDFSSPNDVRVLQSGNLVVSS